MRAAGQGSQRPWNRQAVLVPIGQEIESGLVVGRHRLPMRLSRRELDRCDPVLHIGHRTLLWARREDRGDAQAVPVPSMRARDSEALERLAGRGHERSEHVPVSVAAAGHVGHGSRLQADLRKARPQRRALQRQEWPLTWVRDARTGHQQVADAPSRARGAGENVTPGLRTRSPSGPGPRPAAPSGPRPRHRRPGRGRGAGP